MFKFDLGSKVKDTLTGFSGIVMARSEYMLPEQRTYGIMPLDLKDGGMKKWEWLAEERLVVAEDAG